MASVDSWLCILKPFYSIFHYFWHVGDVLDFVDDTRRESCRRAAVVLFKNPENKPHAYYLDRRP